jgi:type I restriction enzyme S subunit
LQDVQPGNLANFEGIKSIDEVKSGYSRFITGDILLPKVSPSFGHGRAVVAGNLVSRVGFASTEIFTIRANVLSENSYICLCMRARDFLRKGESSYQGVAGVKRVDREVILDWKIRWPEEEVRESIVQSITEAQKVLEDLHYKTESAINCLVELRSSLIQSATLGYGEIDV